LKSFERFLSLLATIPDPRRAEGKLYQLPHVLLFSILAIASGANSYRGICTFIKVHRRKLNKAFKIGWRRPPAHTAIRYILQGLNGGDLIGLFVDLDMRRHQRRIDGERAEHLPCLGVVEAIETALERFAIERQEACARTRRGCVQVGGVFAKDLF
jgi:DDE_Tnp_1-associated